MGVSYGDSGIVLLFYFYYFGAISHASPQLESTPHMPLAMTHPCRVVGSARCPGLPDADVDLTCNPMLCPNWGFRPSSGSVAASSSSWLSRGLTCTRFLWTASAGPPPVRASARTRHDVPERSQKGNGTGAEARAIYNRVCSCTILRFAIGLWKGDEDDLTNLSPT